MKIDGESKYLDYAYILENIDAESIEGLRKASEDRYGSPWGLALKDFFAISEGDLTFIGIEKGAEDECTVLQYYWMESFRECVENVTNLLKALRIPQSAESQRAAQKCLKMNFKESTLVFVRKYFSLHSFTEAENTQVADFIIAKKDEFNSAIYQYTMGEIQKQKLKRKK